ncbi:MULTISPECIES: methyltransferase domain-containing protein [Cyanophyceae]|uniref:TPMT family class I SAM-dependent methyltransferase n=1 Tax=Leptolyngbya subtilissima DQ-A4 TaxID=2933933 RepID=A0ABV0K6K7_9CYAN|nr:methyltransferase domain-containing protein [Nodosilinea sp. FACHB-141]MBD2113561.1 methyltransferase domain-containing protein [Nodosilinea sp. FACHB-141]
MTAQPPSSSLPSLGPDDWEQRYQEGTPRWDLGHPAPAFQTLLNGADAPQPGRAIALGAGRGHDAIFFAQQGFEVTAVDFAPSPIQSLREQAQAQHLSLNLLQKDIFELTPDLAGQFDYAIEHTCFCAIDPALRPDYVALVAELLVPDGELLAVFFTHQRSGGPPFGTTAAEVRQLFEPHFEILTLEPVTNSIPSRQGEEHFGRLRKRG